MIKFICKDLWTLVFRKQIDNLKTNHRGTFVLTDARFQALARMSVDRARGSKGLEEALTKAQAVRVILEFFFLFSFSLLFCSCYHLPCVCMCFIACGQARAGEKCVECEEDDDDDDDHDNDNDDHVLIRDDAKQFLWFPCGIIRGALSGFGLNVTVQAETTDLKGAVFQIRTVGSKP